LTSRRLLAVITGTVYHDADQSLRLDPGEVRLGNRLAYLDANDNGVLDYGEPTANTDEQGSFSFDNVAAGEHVVRLFDGSQNQRQTFPVDASVASLGVELENAIDLSVRDDTIEVLTDRSLLRIKTTSNGTAAERSSVQSLDFEARELVASVLDASSGQSISLIFESPPSDTESAGLWLLPDSDQAATKVLDEMDVQELAFGEDGQGVAVVRQNETNFLFSLQLQRDDGGPANDAMNATDSSPLDLQWSVTSETVPSDTQILTSSQPVVLAAEGTESAAFASRTVVGWPVDPPGDALLGDPSVPALQVGLWSNPAGQWIAGSQTTLAGATELLSFDDASGLLAVRTHDGAVRVHDVDGDFAEIQAYESSVVALSFIGEKNAVATVVESTGGLAFVLRDLARDRELTRKRLNTSAAVPLAIATKGTLSDFYLLDRNGLSSVKLDDPSAYRLRLEPDEAPSLEFGIQLIGENSAPSVTGSLESTGLEDNTATIDASAIATLVSDAERDRIVSLITDPPENGSIEFTEAGDLEYTPNDHFNGSERFSIQFHDGQTLSEPLEVSLSVKPVPDVPTGISLVGGSIPENTAGPYTVGTISVDDPDGSGSHDLQVYDSLFTIDNSSLIYLGPGFDFETEEEWPLTITGNEEDSDAWFSGDVLIRIIDQNDPIKEIWPDSAWVRENTPGAFVSMLEVDDEDIGQSVTFSVDDDRFEVLGDELWLKNDRALDYEAEQRVVLKVTGDDGAGSSLTSEVRVSVGDVPEPVGQIVLTPAQVLELEPGASAGEIYLDGLPAADSYELTVDDPRFEIENATLKLLDNQHVQRAVAEQIEVTIHAQDTASAFEAISQSFVIEVLENHSPFHNDHAPHDVDDSGDVSHLDALVVLNYLNIYGPGPIGPGDPHYGYDVNLDGMVTTLDALVVINYLNAIQTGGGTVGGEPESSSEGTSAEGTSSGIEPHSESDSNAAGDGGTGNHSGLGDGLPSAVDGEDDSRSEDNADETDLLLLEHRPGQLQSFRTLDDDEDDDELKRARDEYFRLDQ
jgi:hypothetical protein